MNIIFSDEWQTLCAWATKVILKLKSLPYTSDCLCFVVMDSETLEIAQIYLNDFGFKYETKAFNYMSSMEVHFKVWVK